MCVSGVVSFFFLSSFCSDEDKQVVGAVRGVVEERPLPESELVASLWQGLMAQVDWSARPDQIEGLALREVSVRPPSYLLCSSCPLLTVIVSSLALCAHHRAILHGPKDGGCAHQFCAVVLL
jgi:hypothetical protein